jgi:hypothetical protein
MQRHQVAKALRFRRQTNRVRHGFNEEGEDRRGLHYRNNLRLRRVQCVESAHSGDGANFPIAWPENCAHTQADDAVVFEDLFFVGFHMPPHPVLTEILQIGKYI